MFSWYIVNIANITECYYVANCIIANYKLLFVIICDVWNTHIENMVDYLFCKSWYCLFFFWDILNVILIFLSQDVVPELYIF